MSETSLTVPKSAAPEVSNEEMDQLSQELGLVGLPKTMVQKLCKLGVGLKESGLVPYANGMVLLTSNAMADAIQLVLRKLKSNKRTIDETRSLSYALGYLTRNVNQTLNQAVKQENVVHEIEHEQDKRRRKSFVPHAVVGAAQNVQIVNNYPAPSEPKKIN